MGGAAISLPGERSRILGAGWPTVEGLRADGSLIPIELSVTEVPLAKGRLFTAILRDLTERKGFQRQLGEAERKRANLARYFSPNMVDELMQSGGDLERARTQIVTMLFVDLIGFTTLSAQLSSVEVIELLRECLAFFEEAVFAHHGTLDKYLGDGLMATFGTPRPGPRDACNALACARLMAAKTVAWNAERRAEGLQPLHVGIGLHHGEVVLGDIGGERRLEFAVLGDTVNVARRIEEMTRSLDIAILASDAVIEAVRREGAAEGLADLQDLGQHVLRGREGLIRLWPCREADRRHVPRPAPILPPRPRRTLTAALRPPARDRGAGFRCQAHPLAVALDRRLAADGLRWRFATTAL